MADHAELIELSNDLRRIALAGFPWASNNQFALSEAVKNLIDVVLAIGDEDTFARLLNGLKPADPTRELRDNDGQPSEQQEWRDYDASC